MTSRVRSRLRFSSRMAGTSVSATLASSSSVSTAANSSVHSGSSSRTSCNIPHMPSQEVGEGQRPVRFLREADDHDPCVERFVRPNGVFDAREQVGLADAPRADEQQVVLRLPARRATQGFDGVVEQVSARDAGMAQALRAGHAGSVQADIRGEGGLRHGTSSTTISARRWRSRRFPSSTSTM